MHFSNYVTYLISRVKLYYFFKPEKFVPREIFRILATKYLFLFVGNSLSSDVSFFNRLSVSISRMEFKKARPFQLSTQKDYKIIDYSFRGSLERFILHISHLHLYIRELRCIFRAQQKWTVLNYRKFVSLERTCQKIVIFQTSKKIKIRKLFNSLYRVSSKKKTFRVSEKAMLSKIRP